MSPPVRILLVDDHPLVRRGFAAVLASHPDLVPSGEAGSYDEALALLEAADYDLAVVDLSLDGGSGLELIKQISQRRPEVRVLVCSMHDEILFAERSLRAGARGYLSKEEAPERTVEAIRRVLEGRIYLSPAMTDRILHVAAGDPAPVTSTLARLSDREIEVFELLGEALSSRQIGERLGLSPKTVETHRENIKQKLGLESGRELLRRAVQWVLEKG